jgi:restriction system protein
MTTTGLALQAVPQYQDLMLPLLKLAADGTSRKIRDVAKAIAESLHLTESQINDTLPDGRNRLIHRLEWARTYLRKAGLLEYPSRGQFKITARGLSVLKENPSRIDSKYLSKFPEFVEFKHPRIESEITEPPDTSFDPEESIENGYQALRAEVESELLTRIKHASPEFFESLVIDLLVAMGYGGSRRDAARAIGRSGDEGVDGVIDEDALGLDVIYVQAKRWSGQSVGRQHIQQFVGALQGKRARKGIFITTSDFASTARDYVKNIDNKVVLIDGATLVRLMFDHGVAVSEVKRYTIKNIDSDYFED